MLFKDLFGRTTSMCLSLVVCVSSFTVSCVEYTPEKTTEDVVEVQEVKEVVPVDLSIQEDPHVDINYSEAEMLARLAWGEARGIKSYAEKAAIMWVPLNRMSDDRWPDDLYTVLTQKNQFYYSDDFPVWDYLFRVACHVLEQYELEKLGYEAERVIPSDYFYYSGDGAHNHFRKEYDSTSYWDWSYTDVYASWEW